MELGPCYFRGICGLSKSSHREGETSFYTVNVTNYCPTLQVRHINNSCPLVLWFFSLYLSLAVRAARASHANSCLPYTVGDDPPSVPRPTWSPVNHPLPTFHNFLSQGRQPGPRPGAESVQQVSPPLRDAHTFSSWIKKQRGSPGDRHPGHRSWR